MSRENSYPYSTFSKIKTHVINLVPLFLRVFVDLFLEKNYYFYQSLLYDLAVWVFPGLQEPDQIGEHIYHLFLESLVYISHNKVI